MLMMFDLATSEYLLAENGDVREPFGRLSLQRP
jgi:hypothetical protein